MGRVRDDWPSHATVDFLINAYRRLIDVSCTLGVSRDMKEAVTGKTEVTASEVAGVPEAEVEAEAMMMVGTVETISEIVKGGALMMTLGVVVVVAEATVVIEVDMVGIVLMHAHLILLAAATTNRQALQLLTINLLPDPLVHRYAPTFLQACTSP